MTSNYLAAAKTGTSVLKRMGFTLATLSLSVSLAYAAPVFEQLDADYGGRVMVTSGQSLPGSDITIKGSGFKPGQEITLINNGTVLNPKGAYVADDKGEFEASLTLPKTAEPGTHPVVVQASKPYFAAVADLKVSPDVPLSGQDAFDAAANKLVQGVYQSAYSPKHDQIFVSSAVGRPPVKESHIVKVNAKALAIEANVAPAADASNNDGRLMAVYGVAVDDANDTVWFTNTRQNTVAVYKQSDLSLVKQFDAGLTPHSRDVLIDEKHGKAYVATPFEAQIVIIDTKTLEQVKNLAIDSSKRGSKFGSFSMALDRDTDKLYVVSGQSAEIAIIDTKTETVEKVFPVQGARFATGIAFDPKTKRLFVSAQGSDNLLIVDSASGETLHNVAVGAGALSVAFDPVSDKAYVANRGAGTVTVVDPQGKIVANLDGGTFPNHVAVDGKGNVYVINKSRGKDDPKGDRISRIALKQ